MFSPFRLSQGVKSRFEPMPNSSAAAVEAKGTRWGKDGEKPEHLATNSVADWSRGGLSAVIACFRDRKGDVLVGEVERSDRGVLFQPMATIPSPPGVECRCYISDGPMVWLQVGCETRGVGGCRLLCASQSPETRTWSLGWVSKVGPLRVLWVGTSPSGTSPSPEGKENLHGEHECILVASCAEKKEFVTVTCRVGRSGTLAVRRGSSGPLHLPTPYAADAACAWARGGSTILATRKGSILVFDSGALVASTLLPSHGKRLPTRIEAFPDAPVPVLVVGEQHGSGAAASEALGVFSMPESGAALGETLTLLQRYKRAIDWFVDDLNGSGTITLCVQCSAWACESMSQWDGISGFKLASPPSASESAPPAPSETLLRVHASLSAQEARGRRGVDALHEAEASKRRLLKDTTELLRRVARGSTHGDVAVDPCAARPPRSAYVPLITPLQSQHGNDDDEEEAWVGALHPEWRRAPGRCRDVTSNPISTAPPRATTRIFVAERIGCWCDATTGRMWVYTLIRRAFGSVNMKKGIYLSISSPELQTTACSGIVTRVPKHATVLLQASLHPNDLCAPPTPQLIAESDRRSSHIGVGSGLGSGSGFGSRFISSDGCVALNLSVVIEGENRNESLGTLRLPLWPRTGRLLRADLAMFHQWR